MCSLFLGLQEHTMLFCNQFPAAWEHHNFTICRRRICNGVTQGLFCLYSTLHRWSFLPNPFGCERRVVASLELMMFYCYPNERNRSSLCAQASQRRNISKLGTKVGFRSENCALGQTATVANFIAASHWSFSEWRHSPGQQLPVFTGAFRALTSNYGCIRVQKRNSHYFWSRPSY